MLDKVTRMAWLYDFYGSLLTKKQQELVELYYHHDYSLAEIASLTGVSRQAVHDLLKRSENALEEYEASLGFLKKYLKQQEIIANINQLLSKTQLDRETCRQVSGMLSSLLEVYQET